MDIRFCRTLALLQPTFLKPCNNSLHTSSSFQKKRIFYNKYIEQLRRKKRINTSFAHDILRNQERMAEFPDDEVLDMDFQQELLDEGKKRRGAYVQSRRMREVRKGPGPRLLTWQQMEHIRFLQQSDPDEWDFRSLAHSFQVPELVIRKVLRNQAVLNPRVIENLDNKARANHKISPSANILDNVKSSMSLTTTEEKQSPSMQEQWGLPEWKKMGWFDGYESPRFPAKTKNERTGTGLPSNTEMSVKWLDEEECEFYEDLYQDDDSREVRVDDDLDSSSHNSTNTDEEGCPFEVKTDDGKSFYSEDGDLIYKI